MTTGENPKAATHSDPRDATGAAQATGTAAAAGSEGASGDEPMTSAQASLLKVLSEQAREPAAYDPELTRTEASRRIDGLRAKLKNASDPPHTA